MPSPLMPDKLDDFVVATLDKYYKREWVNISQNFQTHIFASQMAKMKRTPVDGGTRLNWKVKVNQGGNFQDSELYGVDTPGVTDVLKSATAEWSKQTAHFSYDIDEEGLQSGAEKLIDLIMLRNADMLETYFENMEVRMWTSPTDVDQNPRRPLGIPFWFQKSATEAFGFNGGNPSGFSDGAGGINSDTYNHWKNGTFRYNAITDDDALDKLAEALQKCKFTPPAKFPELGKGVDWGLYTTYEFLSEYQKLGKASNDNIGKDMGKYRIDAVFMGNPMFWVPALTDSSSEAYDSTDPIYGVNWKKTSWCYQKGKEAFRHKPIVAPGQHTVRTVYQDSWGQFKCLDRRSGFVGARVAA